MTTAPVQFAEIPVSALRENPNNPRRRHVEATLADLTASVKAKGVLEPLLVRPVAKKAGEITHEIVAGGRRFKAATRAGLEKVPCVIRELTDLEALELAITENLQRDDVHPLDEAESYRALMKADKLYTAEVVGAKVGKPVSYIYRRLRLLDLEKELQDALFEDRLTIGHAERLARLSPTLRKEAVRDSVWRPLFSAGKEKPGRNDLEPLNVLDAFIRKHQALQPDAADTRHFQPDLAQQIDKAAEATVADDVEEEAGDEAAIAAARASMLQLSDDIFVRVSLRAKPSDPIPLNPNRWRVIKGGDCEYAEWGAVVHGGPYRVVRVCATKKCARHFPQKKKTRTAASAGAAKRPAGKSSWEIQQEKEAVERKAWEALRPLVAPALVDHLGKVVKFGVDLVRLVMTGSFGFPEIASLRNVEKDFGIKLSEKNAAVVLALSTVDLHSRKGFLDSVKPFKFNIGSIEQKLKAAEKKATAKKGKAA